MQCCARRAERGRAVEGRAGRASLSGLACLLLALSACEFKYVDRQLLRGDEESSDASSATDVELDSEAASVTGVGSTAADVDSGNGETLDGSGSGTGDDMNIDCSSFAADWATVAFERCDRDVDECADWAMTVYFRARWGCATVTTLGEIDCGESCSAFERDAYEVCSELGLETSTCIAAIARKKTACFDWCGGDDSMVECYEGCLTAAGKEHVECNNSGGTPAVCKARADAVRDNCFQDCWVPRASPGP